MLHLVQGPCAFIPLFLPPPPLPMSWIPMRKEGEEACGALSQLQQSLLVTVSLELLLIIPPVPTPRM